MTDSTVTADREQLFAKLADPATTGKFSEACSGERHTHRAWRWEPGVAT